MEIAVRKTYYRVRPLVAKEQVVPDEIKSACFDNRQAAEVFALNMHKGQSIPMVVEKLARAGCWLQVLYVG